MSDPTNLTVVDTTDRSFHLQWNNDISNILIWSPNTAGSTASYTRSSGTTDGTITGLDSATNYVLSLYDSSGTTLLRTAGLR
jgi:hypothetical protein